MASTRDPYLERLHARWRSAREQHEQLMVSWRQVREQMRKEYQRNRDSARWKRLDRKKSSLASRLKRAEHRISAIERQMIDWQHGKDRRTSSGTWYDVPRPVVVSPTPRRRSRR